MKNFYRLLLVVATITLTNFGAEAQNVGIGTAAPAQKLDISGIGNTIRVAGLKTGGTFNAAAASSSNIVYVNNLTGDIYSLPAGSAGSILTIVGGVPTWSTTATAGTAWQLTGNSGTTAGTNFIGTTDAVDFVLKTSATERMRINSTGFVGINTTPVGTQQLTVGNSTIGNTAVVGTNTAVYNPSTGGIVGTAGIVTGGAINTTVNTGTAQSVNSGVFGSAGRGNGTTTLGFGTVGLLGNSLPNSAAFPPGGAGVLGATKTGGTAPFAAGVAAFSSGGGYGVYSNVTGGGIAYYAAMTGGGNTIIPGAGNFGVYILGNKTTTSGVYSYMGSKGVATLPTLASAVYATTDSTLGNVWALVANNTKSTTAPTGNGLLVYGTTNEIGTVTLGQNTTTYMTGGTAANGTLVFDNSTNTNTVTLNTGVTSASYALTLPTAQGAASTVLTNDGTGNLSWAAAAPALSSLTNGTGIGAFTYNGSSAASVSIANTGVTAGTYGSSTQVPVYTVNAQGQITSVSNVTISGASLTGTAGGDLTGTYPNPTVVALQGTGVTATAPSIGQVLLFDGTNWAPGSVTGTGTVTSVNATVPLSVTSPTTTPTITLSGTSGAILYGTGTGSAFTAAGISGQVLQSNGSSVPIWVTPSTSGTAWQLTGNTGTVAGTNYIGTTDAVDFVLKTNATERMRVNNTGFVGINAAPVTTQQLTVTTGTLGNSGIVGTNTFAVAAGSGNGAAGVVGLGNGGILTFKDSSALYMDIGVYGSSGTGSYVRNTGAGYIGVGVLGLAGGSSTTFPNSQPLPAAAGVVGASNNGGVGVVGMTSKGGTGVYATTASTNGQVAPLPVSGYGVFAVGSSKSENAIYGFLGSGNNQFPLTTVPEIGASIYATTNLTGINANTGLPSYALAAVNTNSLLTPTGNGLFVYGTTNEIGTVTLGQNTTAYMTGGTTANGTLVFDNSTNTNTVTLNTGITSASYALTLPTAQGAASTVLTNDGSGNLSWAAAPALSNLTNGTGIGAFTYNGGSAASVSIANTGVTAGTYGSSTQVPVYTVNAQGQITSVSNVTISGASLTGTAGGDLTGTYPNPTVVALQGTGVTATAPSIGQVLLFDGTNWAPGSVTGTGTVTSVNATAPLSVTSPTTTPTITLSGTSGAILYGTGTGSAFTTAGTSGQVLQSNGAGVPSWVTPSSSSTAWQLTGNTGTVVGTNYIGTTDAVDFVLKTNATERLRVGSTGYVGINTAPVTGQQLTVTTTGTGSTTPAGIVGSNSLVVVAGSANGAAGIVGLANGGITTFKDSVTLNMSVGVYGSSGPGSYVRNTGSGFVGVGVLGLVGGASTTFPNSQPLPSAAGVVGASNNGGVGVVGMTSKGGTGVFATTASTNGQVSPLPVSGYGVFAVGSSKSEGAVYGFIGNGEDQFPLTTNPAVNASLYGTTNLTGANATTLLNNWAVAAINNNSAIAPTGNGLLVYGTTNEIGTVTLGQNTTAYMTGGTTANGTLVFDNSTNTNTVTLNTGITSASYALTLPTAQGAASTVLTNDGAGHLSWSAATAGGITSVATGTGLTGGPITTTGTISLANTAVTPGTYGDGTDVAQFTVNAQGQLTFAGTIPITGGVLVGTAGGDLTGTYPNPTIAKLQGIGVAAASPTTGQVLTFDGTNWVPSNTAGTGTVTSVSAAAPLSVTSPTSSPNITLSGTAGAILYGTGAGSAFTAAGTAGQVLQSNGSGVPTWVTPSTSVTAWQLTGNAGTTAGTNFIGTTDGVDFVLKTTATERMRVGATGFVGINTAPVGTQQLTVGNSTIGNTAVVGTNTAVYNPSTGGIVGTAGIVTGGAINTTVNTGTAQSVNSGVFGSAGRGNGTTTLGFGTVGLLGNSLPNSAAFPPGGAGVLGATKTGGTAPFAAGVAAFSSGGGYGLYSNVTGGGYGLYSITTGGGIGLYTAETGASSLIPGANGNFGVYVLGNKNTVSGVYSYMGSKGVATLPTLASAVYATTDSTLGNVWALVANNTKSTTAPTGNGLLVYGTTNEIGTVTLGQNTTTYMTGGTAANGTLVFDNSTNTNTVTLNTGVTSSSYALTLPTIQATVAGQVLTNDGVGNLSWTSAVSSMTSVSAAAPLTVTNPTTTPNILLSGTNGGVLYGAGTGVGSAFSTAGTAGQLLQSNGAAAPTWVNTSSVIANAWNISGNTGTTAGTNYIGTTDAQDLVFKTGGIENMRILNSTGYVGIGTSVPTQPLTVALTSNVDKYVVSSAAVQTSLSTDYQNVAVYGFAAGGNNSHGYAVGVMGIIHPISHGGVALYGGVNGGAPALTPANNFYGIYTDANGVTGGQTGYAAAFMNGNVGVGTNAPSQTLEVGTTSGTVRIDGMVAGNSFNGAANSSSNLVYADKTTGDLSALPNGTAGQVLTINGGGVPTWSTSSTGGTVTSVATGTGLTGGTITTTGTISIANTMVTAASYGNSSNYPTFTVNAQGQLTAAGTQPLPTSLPPSGAASGDLNGTYPSPTVAQIQGIGVANTTPATGQVLEYDGANWSPTTLAGSGTVTSVGLSVPGSSIFGVTGSPVTTSGTLGITTTGTSGGVPYFNSSSTLSSSGALTQNGIVLGGGAGGAPTTTAALTNGQVLVGSTGVAPVATTLTPLANSGVSITNAAGSITIGTNGVLNNIVTITGATTSYTPSAGTKAIQVELVGGGGGGGSTTSPGSNGSAGGGGGSGGYVRFMIANPTGPYTVAVGTSGGGGSGGSNGSAGGSTTFNTGATTYTAGGGGGGIEGNANYGVPGGAGGTNSGGATVSINGTPGGTSWCGNTTAGTSGVGGSSFLGGGGAAINLSGTGGPTTGNPGAANSGSGGSGGVTVGHAAATGGAGATGVIIITEYK